MKCQRCNSHKGGMFTDSCYSFRINLCGKCAIELEYPLNNIENSIKCSACGQRFIPKKVWIKTCIDCFIKSQPKKQTNFTFTRHNPQRKIMGVAI